MISIARAENAPASSMHLSMSMNVNSGSPVTTNPKPAKAPGLASNSALAALKGSHFQGSAVLRPLPGILSHLPRFSFHCARQGDHRAIALSSPGMLPGS